MALNLKKDPKKKWFGTWPLKCNLCNQLIGDIDGWFVDGVIKAGPYRGKWAIMCSSCAPKFAVGLGTGVGQAYDAETREKIVETFDELTNYYI